MPPAKKGKVTRKKVEEGNETNNSNLDVLYDPDTIATLLKDLHSVTESKCSQIQKDAEFMITSLEQAFQIEMIKLPNQVKQMGVKRFNEEFGGSLEEFARRAMSMGPPMGLPSSSSSAAATAASLLNKNPRSSTIHYPQQENNNPNNFGAFQTPAMKRANNTTIPMTAARMPKEGEIILSVNGSPLGEFSTVKKPMREGHGIIPQTPGVFVPLKTGEVIDLDQVDVESLPTEVKNETLSQMQAMMDNMRAVMEKLQAGRT